MNPDEIKLESMSKNFEYERSSRAIDEIDTIDEIRNMAKSYLKLYMKQQEVLSNLSSL